MLEDMDKINEREFLIRQPSFPDVSATDRDYLRIANKLLVESRKSDLAGLLPESLLKSISLTLTDYLQDIVADAGLWRSFVEQNRKFYGWSVPFHSQSDDYIDYELNKEDVRFLVWYVIAMLWDEKRTIYPHNRDLIALADLCYDVLDSEYEEAPVNDAFNIVRGLEFNDPEDAEKIYHLGNWLFLHSYLLTPAFALTLHELISSIPQNDKDYDIKLNESLEEAMLQNTTGPLALFTPEWVYLMIEGKLPKDSKKRTNEIHPYYKKFVAATDGKEIAYFGSYEELNKFFISALGWSEGEEHLSQVKGASDYVLLVNKSKGMLLARDIARCIADPDNPYYDKDYAHDHAFDLLTVRGVCPGDLLQFLFKRNWIPDARFPETDDTKIVADNRDFIARCYLQIYYRGD